MKDRLIDTTMPFPTRCVRWRQWYAALRAKFSTWHASVFPDTALAGRTAVSTRCIHIPDRISALARSFPDTLCSSKCRTEPPQNLQELTDGLQIKVRALETHGGMGRIYRLQDVSHVLKVADIRTSWSKYESRNYEVLRSKGIACAHVVSSAVKEQYLVMVLERLEFTMTAFIRAAARTGASPKWVAGMLCGILDSLRDSGLVFGDLSPDNIMFRSVGSGYEIALIDPQFLVPSRDFLKSMGSARGNAFDTVYLSLKVHAIGILDKTVLKFCESVCVGILGHVPREKQTRRWLTHEAPVGLFVAYDILSTRKNLGALS